MRRKNICIDITALLLCCTVFVHAQPSAEEDLDSLSLEDLMSIQVTSVGRKPQNLSDSAAAIFVITSKDLLQSGATSIPEALRMVPGLHVARINSSKWAVSSRGFNSRFTEKLLVLIDGRTVYTPDFSGVYWEVQDMLLEDVERIEVIRGPGASLWGANAVNGVINIITKHAADTCGGLFSAGTGTAEQAFGGVRYGTSLGKGAYGRVYAKYFERNEFEYKAGGGAGDDWNIFRSGFRFDSKLAGPADVTFQGDVYTGAVNQRAVSTPWPEPPYALTVEDDVDVSGGNLLIRWQRQLSSSSDVTLQAYYDRTERDDVYTRDERDSFDLDFQHRFVPAGGHDMIWGVRYRFTRDHFSPRYILEFDPDSRNDQLFSAFIQDEISIVKDSLWLILGSKFEHNDYSGFEIQPSGRLLWAPHPDHRLWTAVSRAVRTPSRQEHDERFFLAMIPPSPSSAFLPVKITIVGNDAFDSEELTAYEAGYRFVPSSGFSLDITAFYNDYEKLREYIPAEPVLEETYIDQTGLIINGPGGDVYGLEVSVSWQPEERLKADLAYSYLNTDIIQGGVGREAPKHQMSLRTELRPAETFDIDVWLRYVGDTKADDNSAGGFGVYEINEYLTLDLRLSWRIGDSLELIAAGQNLLDQGHMEYVQEVLIAPTEIPRSFYGQVRYSF